jgi:hypothetical protein
VTCVEITIIAIIVAMIGACIYLSLHNAPPQHTETKQDTSSLNIANTKSSVPMLVTIPVPKTQALKLVTVVPEEST